MLRYFSLIASVITAAILLLAAPVWADSFGSVADSGIVYQITEGVMFVAQYTSDATTGTTDSVTMIIDYGTTGGDSAIAVIYTDNGSNVPNALVGYSDTLAINSYPGTYKFIFSDEVLSGSTKYWIGIFVTYVAGTGPRPHRHTQDGSLADSYTSTGNASPPETFSGTKQTNYVGPYVIVYYTPTGSSQSKKMRAGKGGDGTW